MRAADPELSGYELDAADGDAGDAGDGSTRILDGRRLTGALDVHLVLPGPDSAAAADPTRFLRLRTVEGIVPVVDAGFAPTGRPYVVVERWSTGDLADRLDDGPLSPAETVLVGRRVGRALIGAHDVGIVHGALTPACVVVADDGRPRLAGFATAPGTPTAADDLAALGALLHACLDRGDATPLADRDDVPADVAEVVGRASSDTGERRLTLDELVDDLDQLAFRHGWIGARLRGVSPDTDDAGPAIPTRRPRGRAPADRRRIVLIGATALVLVVVVGWLAARWRADTADPVSPTAASPVDPSADAPPELDADAEVDAKAPGPPTSAGAASAPQPDSAVVSPPGPPATTSRPATSAPATTAAPAAEPLGAAVDAIENDDGTGGWQLLEDGRVRPFGEAPEIGTGQLLLAPDTTPVALVAGGPGGLLVISSEGRVITVGSATHLGDLADVALSAPVVDAAASATGRGYVLLGADGGLFSFGDAAFRGSATGLLSAPAVGLVALDDSHLVFGRDGGWVRLGAVVAQGRLPDEATPVRSVQRLGGQVVVSTDAARTASVDLAVFGA